MQCFCSDECQSPFRELEREEIEDLLDESGLRLSRSDADELVRELWEASKGNWSRLVRLVTQSQQTAQTAFQPRQSSKQQFRPNVSP